MVFNCNNVNIPNYEIFYNESNLNEADCCIIYCKTKLTIKGTTINIGLSLFIRLSISKK